MMPRSRTTKTIFESVRNDSGGILGDFRDNWPPRDYPEEGQHLDVKDRIIRPQWDDWGQFRVKTPH